MIGGHYDHLGVSSTGRVFNGATDNAAGTAVVLAVAGAIRSLPEPPRRSILIVLWDAEEDGLLGSLAWVADPAIPLDRTVAYVNLDIQGANLTPGLSRTSFAVGGETGGAALQDAVERAVAGDARSFASAVDTLPISYIFGQLRSDYASLVGAGVPTVFFSDSTGACYHTTRDDVRYVDFDKLASQSRIAYRTTMTLAEAAERPAFVEPNPQLAVYDDAITLNTIYERARADLNRFDSADRRAVQEVAASVAAIVARGPDAFTGADAGVLLNAAATTISFLEGLECGGYFGRRGPYLVPGERDHGHDHGTRPPVEPRRLPLTRR
jgi:Zn-dependent M28 family amino/carboxypeptidase